MEKSKERVWQVLFGITLVLLLVVGGKELSKSLGACVAGSMPSEAEEEASALEETPAYIMEAPKPLHHYEIKSSVAAEGYTEFVPSSQYQMKTDSTGVTFLSPSGHKLLRCNVMERLNTRWPDPNDPLLLRHRTVYEDFGYRAVFEYVEEWADADGSVSFKVGPVAFFHIPK